MRIVYKDNLPAFAALLQEAVQNRDKVEAIYVSRAELAALIRHRDSRTVLREYWERRDYAQRAVDRQVHELALDLERATTEIERTRIWNAQSDCAAQLRKLEEDVPASIREGGVTIRVSMSG